MIAPKKLGTPRARAALLIAQTRLFSVATVKDAGAGIERPLISKENS
jgi:hypothetical protein